MPDARADTKAEPTSVLRFDAGGATGMAAAASRPVGSKSVTRTSQPSAKPPLRFLNGFSCVRSWNVRLIERGLGSATPRVDDQTASYRGNIRHPRDLMAYRAFSVPSGTSTCAEGRSPLILDAPSGQGDGAGLGSANPGRTPASVIAPLGRSRRGSRHLELTTNFRISRELQQHGSPSAAADVAVCPRRIMTMIRMHTMHREASSARAARRQAQPSQREGQGFESP